MEPVGTIASITDSWMRDVTAVGESVASFRGTYSTEVKAFASVEGEWKFLHLDRTAESKPSTLNTLVVPAD